MPALPTAPGAWPLLGHFVPLARDPLAFLASLPAHGGLVRIRLGPRHNAVVVCDPDLTQHVLLHDRIFDKGGPLADRAREAFGHGLATCAHGHHRRQRRLLQPAFHLTRMPGYARLMAEQIEAVTHTWRDGQALDVAAEMSTLTSRVLIATMFADALSATAHRQTLDDLGTLVRGVYWRMFRPPPLDRLPLPDNRRYQQAHTRFRATVERIAIGRGSTDRDDLLSILLTARDTVTGSGLTDAEIHDQVLIFFVAGAETTASTLAWALHLLACHPTIERQVHAEVDTVVDGGTARFEHLPRLALTGHVITETLRLFPPVWISMRVTTADTDLGGHRLPAGTTIVYSPYLIHHRSELYPDPDRFDPGRWAPGQPLPAGHGAFIPFAGGARKCIGDQFGMTEAVLTLATITARWRLTRVPGQRVHPGIAAVLVPRGLHLRLERRPNPA